MTVESDSPIALVIAAVFVCISLLMMVKPDLFWGIDDFSNQLRGAKSEKTEAWRRGTRLTGLIFLIISTFFLVGIFLEIT